MDEYIVIKCKDGKGSYFYYKNGKLHREAGPAIVVPSKENNNFGDEHLYKEQLTLRETPFGYKPQKIKLDPETMFFKIVNAKYYLEGQYYTQEQFEAIKEKLALKNDLLKELPSNKEQNKTNKL